MKINAWGPFYALLGLCALAGVGLFQDSKPYGQPGPPKLEHRNGPIPEAVVQALPIQVTKKRNQEMTWYEPFFEKPTDTLLVIFNGLLAIFTWRLYVATKGLFTETAGLRTAADQQAVDMKASIAVAQDSVTVAKRAADVAERTLELSSRPWVKVQIELTGPLSFDAETYELPITITITNVGNSPTTKADYFLKLCPTGDAAVEIYHRYIDMVRGLTAPLVNGDILFPGAPQSTEHVIGFDQGTWIEQETGTLAPCIVVCAFYSVPTDNRIRHTSFIRAIIRTDGGSDFDNLLDESPLTQIAINRGGVESAT